MGDVANGWRHVVIATFPIGPRPSPGWRDWKLSDRHHLTILPRKGEVAGVSLTEGEAHANLCSVSSPSVTFGDTSP